MPGSVIRGRQRAPKHRCDPQRGEKVAGDGKANHAVRRPSGLGEAAVLPAPWRRLLENRRLLHDVTGIRRGQLRELRLRRRRVNTHDPVRVRVRWHPVKDHVDQRERGRIDPDSQRKSHDGDGREAQIFCKLA